MDPTVRTIAAAVIAAILGAASALNLAPPPVCPECPVCEAAAEPTEPAAAPVDAPESADPDDGAAILDGGHVAETVPA